MEEIFIHIKDDFFPAIVFSMFFVWALVMWVREGDNDEQLQNQIDGKERVMKIGDEVYVHGYVDEIRNDCIIIRNEGGYFGTITSEITADRKTEPQTAECPFDDTIPCEWVCTEYGKCKYKPKTEPQYDIDKGTIKCDNCSENGSYKCSKCDGEMYFKRLEVEDEPQTEREGE